MGLTLKLYISLQNGVLPSAKRAQKNQNKDDNPEILKQQFINLSEK